jgi:hypothetical protein
MAKATGILKISAKCSDLFSATVMNENGRIMGIYDGYVPKFMPGEHFGDYVELDIDLQTGKILNWKAPSETQIAELIDKD